MATCLITEFKGVQVGEQGGEIQVAKSPITTQSVTFTTSTASAAFSAGCRVVRIIADAAVYLEFGEDPTATATAIKLPRLTRLSTSQPARAARSPATMAAANNLLESYDASRRKTQQRQAEYQDHLQTLDPVDREISELLQDPEADELNELRTLVKSLDVNEARDYSERVGTALERAARQGNYSALKAFDRELNRAREEEEFLTLAMTMLN